MHITDEPTRGKLVSQSGRERERKRGSDEVESNHRTVKNSAVLNVPVTWIQSSLYLIL